MEKRNFSVYKHTFPNKKVYIGITGLKPQYRWNSGKGYKNQLVINRAIQKYGWNNIEYNLLQDGLIDVARELGLNIWSYTGYKFEYLLEHANEFNKWKEYLENIDVLVDGKFDINKKEDGLRFRGSSNQRIINVKESLKEGKVIELEF